jgi:hypothetical protein
MLGVEDDQIEALARVAVMQGCHGVLFRSRSPLNANDPNTRRRAALMELVNRQMQLIGPWIAGGATAGGVISAGETAAAVLWVDQARLLLPTVVAERATGSNLQHAASNFVAPRSFTVPGVPDSYQAFSLTPVAMRQLTLKRVAGGSRVVLESADDAMVVITRDAQVTSGLRQAVARDGAATIRLARDVAAMRASAIAETDRRLAAIGKDTRESEQEVASATALLRQADPFLSAGRLEPAYTLVRSARRLLRQATERQWASAGESPPLRSLPLAISYDTLVAHA